MRSTALFRDVFLKYSFSRSRPKHLDYEGFYGTLFKSMLS